MTTTQSAISLICKSSQPEAQAMAQQTKLQQQAEHSTDAEEARQSASQEASAWRAPGTMQLKPGVGKLRLHQRAVRQPCPKGGALLHALRCIRQGRLANANCTHAVMQTARSQPSLRYLKAASFAQNDVLLWHPAYIAGTAILREAVVLHMHHTCAVTPSRSTMAARTPFRRAQAMLAYQRAHVDRTKHRQSASRHDHVVHRLGQTRSWAAAR